MNKLTKNIVITFGIGIIVFMIGNSLYNGFRFKNFNDFLISFGFYQLYSFGIGFTNISFFSYLQKQDWKETDLAKRVIVGVLGSVVLTLISLFFLRMFTAVLYEGNSFDVFLKNENRSTYVFGIWITLSIVAVFHFIFYYKKYQENKVKESQIVAKNQTAKFESLKNQLDPHFLFNSLNVLTSLIGENPKQAEKFTTKLSKVYRYVLEQKDKDLIPLEEELKFAKSYMELLKMRFEEGIDFSIIDQVSNKELKIVPLSLQLLLENAVKHNVITSSNPLEINIYQENGFLVVENNINLKKSIEKSTKVGLKNIHQRYALISKTKVEITSDNNLFKVKLPLLTQKIKTMKTDYLQEDIKYIRAKKRLDDIKAFYGNLIAYCVVIPLLIVVNYRSNWDHKWFIYPMVGWGLGVLIQAFTVFGYGAKWEERKMKEIMKNDNF